MKGYIEKENLVETPKRIYARRSDYAERVLSEALGERYIDYRKRWVEVSRREIVSDFPLYIQIEHSGQCNLRCPICIKGIDGLREDYSRSAMPFEIGLYKKILDEARQYSCPSISFHNNDEPLLLSDLEYRVKLAKEAGFLDIILTTNAMLLDQKRTDQLLMSGVTKINFSVDAFNEADYRERRRGGDFNIILKNIEYFLEQRRKANLKLPIARVTCVLTKDSVKDMNRFWEFWMKRVDVVEFQNFQAIKGYTEEFRPPGSMVDDSFTCNGPWQQVVIRANGEILPCCSFYGTEMVLGNIAVSSIYDVWNGHEMRKIREELLLNNFDFSPACKKCSETFYTLIENGNYD